ncbi:MAG: hypothetical protein JO112_23285, partial [Planctomycetes bacterium]|nr:hypothetical protein [Planctomycetota bacterium]
MKPVKRMKRARAAILVSFTLVLGCSHVSREWTISPGTPALVRATWASPAS